MRRRFLGATLPLALAASTLSGIAGYAYGVHSAKAAGALRERMLAAPAPSVPVRVADPDVIAASPSWRRWPQLTDF